MLLDVHRLLLPLRAGINRWYDVKYLGTITDSEHSLIAKDNERGRQGSGEAENDIFFFSTLSVHVVGACEEREFGLHACMHGT